MRGPSRFGGLGTLSAAFNGTAGYAELTVVLDEGLGVLRGDEAWLTAYDGGISNPVVQHLAHTSQSSGGFQTAIYAGVVASCIDTSPTVAVTFSNVRVGFRWRTQTS